MYFCFRLRCPGNNLLIHTHAFPSRGRQVTGRTEPELWWCRPGLESLLVAVQLSVFRQTVEFLRASVSAQDDFGFVGAGEGLQVAGTVLHVLHSGAVIRLANSPFSVGRSTRLPPEPGKCVVVVQNPSDRWRGADSSHFSPGTAPHAVRLFLPQRLTRMGTQAGRWFPLSLGPEEGKKEFRIVSPSAYIPSSLLVRTPQARIAP